MIPFYLITGFLGSGKTTLLKNILHEEGSRRRIAVIQNEYAPTGVDGQELRREFADFKLVEINNGSVFCVCQLSNFIESVQKLVADYQPEVIYLETSGLADPINIAELLQSDQLKSLVSLSQVITIVDGQNFFKGLNTLTRFKHQLMISDLCLINKLDLLEDKLPAIEKEVRKLNPFVQIEHTTYCKVDLELLMKDSGIAASQYMDKESAGRPDITACVLRTHDTIDRASLDQFLNEMKGITMRVKGFVNMKNNKTASFHAVFDQVDIEEISGYEGPAEIIAFGKDLTAGTLRNTFRKFTRKS